MCLDDWDEREIERIEDDVTNLSTELDRIGKEFISNMEKELLRTDIDTKTLEIVVQSAKKAWGIDGR